jgi:putative ABC transport system substrate-binding protein
MRRREFIALLGSALATWPVVALAQTVNRARRIGFLSSSAEEDAEAAKRLAAFKLRLQELGWTEGKNLQIDVRFGSNNGERIHQAATELTEVAPDVIVSTTSTTTRALMNATGNIPIVAAVSGDPIALGFTKNLSHPTENITGFTTFNDTLAAKRFEMLHEIVPTYSSRRRKKRRISAGSNCFHYRSKQRTISRQRWQRHRTDTRPLSLWPPTP